MEGNSSLETKNILGARLDEIQKKTDKVKLVFANPKTRRKYVLTFNGLLFESTDTAINRRVKNFQINGTLGFRATSQLTSLKMNPNNYQQMYIQLEGSDEEKKLELLGAYKNFKITRRPYLRNAEHGINKKAS